jgi:hypothetical protein
MCANATQGTYFMPGTADPFWVSGRVQYAMKSKFNGMIQIFTVLYLFKMVQ